MNSSNEQVNIKLFRLPLWPLFFWKKSIWTTNKTFLKFQEKNWNLLSAVSKIT